MSAYGQVEQALEAVRKGAYDYLAKPFQAEELLLAIRKAEERERLRRENRQLRRELSRGAARGALVAASPAMREIVRADRARRGVQDHRARSPARAASARRSSRARCTGSPTARRSRSSPVNCGAIPETLIESELFGHVRGAFTGAEQRSAAACSARPTAARSSSTRSASCRSRSQVKLLRVLQEEEVRPVGAAKSHPGRRAHHRRDRARPRARWSRPGPSAPISSTA